VEKCGGPESETEDMHRYCLYLRHMGDRHAMRVGQARGGTFTTRRGEYGVLSIYGQFGEDKSG